MNSISQLINLMQVYGAKRFYAKKLAPNDNSKNQVYLGGDFSALNIIPYGEMYTDANASSGSKKDRIKANINFFWVNKDGKYPAPEAQIIFYPKYPEVRMSGFLKGCRNAPSDIMRVRDEGRVLFLGITDTGDVLGYASQANDLLSKEINAKNDWEIMGVFIEIPPRYYEIGNTRHQLLSKLKSLYEKHWIPSQKMKADGTIAPYSARNGGGYTLEAELGISPNSYAEPDFLGWEIKQYGVSDFINYRPKSPVTLLTPEPTGGFYSEGGVKSFILRFGYPDKKGKPDRLNFGGVYSCGKTFHNETGLKMQLIGYDEISGKISDVKGGIALISEHDEVAAIWHFTGIMKHWNKKHAQAAYVPSIYHTPPPEYAYGPKVLLGEETDFLLFLRAIANGVIYYDPGVKYEGVSTSKPEIKRRSQFRIKHSDLHLIYHRTETVFLNDFNGCVA